MHAGVDRLLVDGLLRVLISPFLMQVVMDVTGIRLSLLTEKFWI